MDQYSKRLAAAAYDRACPEHDAGRDRVVFVGVQLEPGVRRTLLCQLTLTGDPPECLRASVADTLALLRTLWIALLEGDDEEERRRLATVHAALQCDLVTADWSWSTGRAEARALARSMARAREGYRARLAMPPPYGLGLVLPLHSRATEPLPEALRIAHDEADDGAYAAIGAWRLGERPATPSQPPAESSQRPVEPPQHGTEPLLREAS
jgi:hypothetical protein